MSTARPIRTPDRGTTVLHTILGELELLMLDQGEGWAVEHARRLTGLIEQIGGGIERDDEVLALAVWTHDWGAFRRYGATGPDHAHRSAEVVADLLREWPLDASQGAVLIEAIDRHDYRDERPTRSAEALLLREADMLDLLGATGAAREFAWGPDLLSARQRIAHRLAVIPGRLTLPAARELGVRLAERTAQFLDWFDDEAGGVAPAPHLALASPEHAVASPEQEE
ncbi:MAG TPA: HD domain-containing protein [Actinotalea sp.]|nr:HD domain-containing protein [Actinotalea sp.]